MCCLAVVITATASAQKYGRHYPPPRVRTTISVGVGSPYYSPYSSRFYRPAPYYNAPIYSRPTSVRPTRLENEIADIKADYNDRIWSARHDNSLSKSQKKMEIRQLKSERDRVIREAEYSYHRRRY